MFLDSKGVIVNPRYPGVVKTALGHIYRCQGDEVEGLCSVYGVPTATGERLHRGMWDNLRAPGQLEYFYCHDDEKAGGPWGKIARIKALFEVRRSELPRAVQEAHPEATGGLVVVREYLDNENGRDAKAMVRSGQIKEMSIHYRVHSFGWTADGLLRDIYRASLIEVSDVDHGACPGTIARTGGRVTSQLEGKHSRYYHLTGPDAWDRGQHITREELERKWYRR